MEVEESASARGARIIEILSQAGKKAGLEVQPEYPVVGGRIDLVWLWRGPTSFPSLLPVVGFEIESSWRTRKHIKGDYLNLFDLQPALGVIVLLGEGPDVESTRKFTREMIDRRTGRMVVWSEADVLKLGSSGADGFVGGLLADSGASVEDEDPETTAPQREATAISHTGKYRALAAWLARQSSNRVDATFNQIEEILGFPLPPSSRRHVQHWHGYEGSAVARAIIDAGWVARNVNLTAEKVSFERRA